MPFSFLAALWNRPRSRSTERPQASPLCLERLEDRRLAAVDATLDKRGLLTIVGDKLANDAVVEIVGDQVSVTVTTGATVFTKSFAAAQVVSLKFRGYDGDDSFVNNTGLNSLAYGDNGNDRLVGGSGADVLNGGAGDDVLIGNGGNDKLYGTSGHDVLEGGAGDDYLNGGKGNNRFVFAGVGLGTDSIDDPAGVNTLDFGEFDRPIWLDLGKKALQDVGYGELSFKFGRPDVVDHVIGTRFNDVVYGNALANNLYGGDGDDWLNGMGRNDQLWGEAGDDVLIGGAGDDLLVGGDGADDFYGEAGFDRYRDDFTLFINGASLHDISQGESGICTILAALGSTFDDRDWTEDVRSLGESLYEVYLYNKQGVGYWQQTTFDGTWSDEDARPVMAASGTLLESWVIIVVRAALTRDGVNWATTREAKWGTRWQYPDVGLETFYPGDAPWAAMKAATPTALKAAMEAGDVAVGSNSSRGTTVGGTKFVADHAYTLLDVFQQGGVWYVTMYNPWGVDGYDSATQSEVAITGPNDGVFTVAWGDFTANFSGYAYT